MASNYSTLRDYGKYVSPYNLQLIQAGLAMKQQKYDANYARIQAEIDSLTNLKFIREVDKDYLNKKVQGIRESVGNLGQKDLSSSKITQNIYSNIKEAIDDVVLTSYKSTMNYKNDLKSIAQIKEKHRDLYSPINQAYSLRGAQRWLRGKTPGEEYKGMNYVPYVDLQKKFNKIAFDLSKSKKDREIQVPLGDGRIEVKKFSTLTGEELRSVIVANFNQQDIDQLKVNGWYNNQNKTPEQALLELNKYFGGRVNTLNVLKEDYKIKLRGETNENKIAAIERMIEFLDRKESVLTQRFTDIPKNPSAIGAFLERESLINRLIQAYSFNKSDVTFESDAPYWKAIDTKIKSNKASVDIRAKEAQIEEKQIKAQSTIGTGIGRNMSAPLSHPPILHYKKGGTVKKTEPYRFGTHETIGTEPASLTDVTIDLEKSMHKELDSLTEHITGLCNNIKAKMPDKDRQNFDILNQKYIQMFEGTKSAEEVTRELLLKLGKGGYDSSIVPLEQYDNLKKNVLKLRERQQSFVNAQKFRSEKMNEGLQAVYNTMQEDNPYGVMYNASTDYNSYLKSKGINNWEALKANPAEHKNLALLVYSKMFQRANYNTSDMDFYLNNISTVLGEAINFSDLFEVGTSKMRPYTLQGVYVPPPSFVQLKKNISKNVLNSKTVAYLKQRNLIPSPSSKSGRSLNSPFIRGSVHKVVNDVRDTAELLYGEKLKESASKFKRSQYISLSPDSPYYSQVKDLLSVANEKYYVDTDGDVQSVLNRQGYKPDEKAPLYLYYDKGRQQYDIRQYNREKEDISYVGAFVTESDMSNKPGLRNILKVPQDSNIGWVDNMPSIKADTIMYQSTTDKVGRKRLEDLAEFFKSNANPSIVKRQYELLSLIAKGDVEDMFFGATTPSGNFGYGAITHKMNTNKLELNDIGKLYKAILDDPSKFKVELAPDERTKRATVQVSAQGDSGEPLSISLSKSAITTNDHIMTLMNVSPEYFVTLALAKILREQYTRMLPNNKDFRTTEIKNLKKIYNIDE